MSTRLRRSFRPNLDGFWLEDRVVLDAASVTKVGDIAAAAATIDPLVQPPKAVIKSGFFQQTPILLQAAFQNFLNNENRAAQGAVRRLANGQDPNALLASLKTNTSLQGGILEAKVEQISKRIPGGEQYLFNPPPGADPHPPRLRHPRLHDDLHERPRSPVLRPAVCAAEDADR